MSFLGIDTSNYTTSAALMDSGVCVSKAKLLDTPAGAIGLRQSDAVFQHVNRLPELIGELFAQSAGGNPEAVAASVTPRRREGSYMPCFLPGKGTAQAIAAAFGVPFYGFSHQEGHLAAVIWSKKAFHLMQTPHLAWHLSGGTTELLYVIPETRGFSVKIIGGALDLSVGQLIDRTGALLGLKFPSGAELDRLAVQCGNPAGFDVKCADMRFSLSGIENKVGDMAISPDTETAGFVMRTIANAIEKATAQALKEYPGLPVVFTGGVSSSSFLRNALKFRFDAVFGAPEYSTDNAAGIAYLASVQK